MARLLGARVHASCRVQCRLLAEWMPVLDTMLIAIALSWCAGVSRMDMTGIIWCARWLGRVPSADRKPAEKDAHGQQRYNVSMCYVYV